MQSNVMTRQSKNITIELKKVYGSFADQLNVSASISGILHGLSDIKASGNEIEVALRNVFQELLPTRYTISHGHIVDKSLNVSRQYDFIISEGQDFRSILKTKDTTEIFFYETVFATGEVKATWNRNSFNDTVSSIHHLKSELNRNVVDNRTILSGNNEIHLSSEITSNPNRNPLFCFAFAIKSEKGLAKISADYKKKENWSKLPNVTVILNEGLYVLINKRHLTEGKLTINLYPEFQISNDDFEWKFISSSEGGQNVAFLLFCLLEHLSNTLLEKPSYLLYSSSLLSIKEESLINLDDL